MNFTELIFENTMLKLSLIELELNEEFRKVEQKSKPTKQQMEKYLESKDDLREMFMVITDYFDGNDIVDVLLDCFPDDEEDIVNELLDKVGANFVLDGLDDYSIREWICENYCVEDLVEWR